MTPIVNWTSLSGRIESKIERLPVGSAIYAIYLDVTVGNEISDDALIQHIQEICALPFGIDRTMRLGGYQTLTVNHKSGLPLDNLSKQNLKELLQVPSQKNLLIQNLEVAQSILPPLYIGETGRLQDRISDHFRTDSDIRNRLEDAGINTSKLAIRYWPIEFDFTDLPEDDESDSFVFGGILPSSEEDPSKKLLLCLEEILTRLVRPGFTEKIGSKILKTSEVRNDE